MRKRAKGEPVNESEDERARRRRVISDEDLLTKSDQELIQAAAQYSLREIQELRSSLLAELSTRMPTAQEILANLEHIPFGLAEFDELFNRGVRAGELVELKGLRATQLSMVLLRSRLMFNRESHALLIDTCNRFNPYQFASADTESVLSRLSCVKAFNDRQLAQVIDELCHHEPDSDSPLPKVVVIDALDNILSPVHQVGRALAGWLVHMLRRLAHEKLMAILYTTCPSCHTEGVASKWWACVPTICVGVDSVSSATVDSLVLSIQSANRLVVGTECAIPLGGSL